MSAHPPPDAQPTHPHPPPDAQPTHPHPPPDAQPTVETQRGRPAAHLHRDGEQGWSALHGGLRPSTVVRLWLRGVQGIARLGLVARVPPDVLSVAGVAACGGALTVAGRWPFVAAALAVLAGVLDGLDGAVALHAGRARPLGAVVDGVADRVGDLLLVGTLAVLGAPPPWCVAAGALTLLHEYLRARAGAVGMPGVGAVTVAERPVRIVIVVVACLGAATWPAGTPLAGWNWGAVSVVLWLAVGVVGFVHLAVAVARTTPRRFPDGPAPR